MKKLNSFARSYLLGKLYLPSAIIIVLDAMLYLMGKEPPVVYFLLTGTILYFISISIALIFLPSYMNTVFYIQQYLNHLHGVIRIYQAQIENIGETLSFLEEKEIEEFIIGPELHGITAEQLTAAAKLKEAAIERCHDYKKIIKERLKESYDDREYFRNIVKKNLITR